ncbi:coiled-coil domain-containing protein 87-like isoform X1 [Tubulanus polymorphus]|uniref:coiled-coil domain-containing protein 87-like isoform X1 n=1 Tax=Tubulanus polymorphus TaxID=672921 RepID=UPI003DA3F590
MASIKSRNSTDVATSISSTAKHGDMYKMTQLSFGANDIQQRYEDILGPLTLFAPYAHEDVDINVLEEDAIKLQRPETPTDDDIVKPPKTFNQLSKFIRRRIAPDSEIQHMTLEDQQDLGSVILGELNGIWPDIRDQVNDPFLSNAENVELQRKTAVHIVTVCETLMKHYVQKVQILNSKGIFTGPANMSRLKVQLALDANKYLNVQMIRRFLLEEMREKPDEEQDETIEERPASKSTLTTSYNTLLLSSRHQKSKRRGRKQRSIEDEIKEINKHIPDHLATDKLWPIMNDLMDKKWKPNSISSSKTSSFRAESSRKSDELSPTCDTNIKRSNSLPHIQVGENLLEELEMEPPTPRPPSAHLVKLPEKTHIKKKQEDKNKPLTAVDKAADLHNLLRKPPNTATNSTTVAAGAVTDADADDEDMPPLLQAITQSSKHDGRKEKLRKQIKELELKEEKEKAKENIPLREPIYPQPATVALKPDKKNEVRISDVRVSERVCLSSMTVYKYSTVYNDLLGEIDAVTIKEMDKNLFMGDEIREVYSEIMKTVPADHLSLEHDDLIEPTAQSVDLHSIMMPSALVNRSKENVVNTSIQKHTSPPWGQQTILQWAKMPGTVGNQDDAAFNPLQTNRDLTDKPVELPSKIMSIEEYKEKLSDAPRMVQERLSRNYASWLTWWKNNIDSDDYMKYLAAQDTDYLGYIFHFYESDDDDEDDGHRSGPSRKSKKSASSAASGKLSRSRKSSGHKSSAAQKSNLSKPREPSRLSSALTENKAPSPTAPPEFDFSIFEIENEGGTKKKKRPEIPKIITKSDLDSCFKSVLGKRKFKRFNRYFGMNDGEVPRTVLGKGGVLVIDDLSLKPEQQEILNEMKSEKSKFTPGLWNPNSILMGGLGKDPELPESVRDLMKSPLTDDSLKTKSGMSIIKKVSKTSQEDVSTRTSGSVNEMRPMTRTSKTSRTTLQTRTSTATAIQDMQESVLTPQDRLEKVWATLHIPDNMKLDMAIKYSSDNYIEKLEAAIDAWEKATALIEQREKIITRLENFERFASDPTRFFERGYRGSSVARLEEARQRSAFYSKLEEVEHAVRIAVTYVFREYQDVITYQGRPYLDKMQWDRTEMLHWLQEERKQNLLEKHSIVNNLPLNITHLEPLQT